MGSVFSKTYESSEWNSDDFIMERTAAERRRCCAMRFARNVLRAKVITQAFERLSLDQSLNLFSWEAILFEMA